MIKKKTKEDLGLIFGACAAELAEQYEDNNSGNLRESAVGDTSGLTEGGQDNSSIDKASTPLRNISRGRIRLRDSGRSSTNSPSPFRPRLDTGFSSSPALDTGGGPSLDEVIEMGIDPDGTPQPGDREIKVHSGKDLDVDADEDRRNVTSSEEDI